MGNIESVDGQSEMKHHIMPLKVPMPDPTELEEKFAIVLVSYISDCHDAALFPVPCENLTPLKYFVLFYIRLMFFFLNYYYFSGV